MGLNKKKYNYLTIYPCEPGEGTEADNIFFANIRTLLEECARNGVSLIPNDLQHIKKLEAHAVIRNAFVDCIVLRRKTIHHINFDFDTSFFS